MAQNITIIGDVHGYYDRHMQIVSQNEYTVQVGDFGFRYDCLNRVDNTKHKIIGGNHDNYDAIINCRSYLGDFGVMELGGIKFFFVRGERSVDKHLRVEGRNWWKNEELTIAEGYAAIEAYEKATPNIVISHGCPSSVLPYFVQNSAKYKPSRTAQILDGMLNVHMPKLWIFGHHHISKQLIVGECRFCCLNELESFVLTPTLE